MSRESPFGIARGCYGPGFYSRQGQDFSVLHHIQSGSRATHLAMHWVQVALFPPVKREGYEAHGSPDVVPRSGMVKNTSTPPYVFVTWCVINHKDNFISTTLPSTYCISTITHV